MNQTGGAIHFHFTQEAKLSDLTGRLTGAANQRGWVGDPVVMFEPRNA